MKTLKILTLNLLIGITLQSCTTGSSAIVTDYDVDADFDTYQTFYWSDDFQMENGKQEEPLFFNTLIKKRLKSAIHDEMISKGYTLDNTNPDLLIDAQIFVETKNVNTNYGNPYPYYGRWYGYYSSYPSTKEQKEGGVVIEIIDMDRHQLIWQGFAPNVLHANTEDKQKEIKEAVSKIFDKYEYGDMARN